MEQHLNILYDSNRDSNNLPLGDPKYPSISIDDLYYTTMTLEMIPGSFVTIMNLKNLIPVTGEIEININKDSTYNLK